MSPEWYTKEEKVAMRTLWQLLVREQWACKGPLMCWRKGEKLQMCGQEHLNRRRGGVKISVGEAGRGLDL